MLKWPQILGPHGQSGQLITYDKTTHFFFNRFGAIPVSHPRTTAGVVVAASDGHLQRAQVAAAGPIQWRWPCFGVIDLDVRLQDRLDVSS